MGFWNKKQLFPYTNNHDENLDYMMGIFENIKDEWQDLYTTLQAWKVTTTEELEAWRTDVLNDIDEWETALRTYIDTWKTETEEDISEWEEAVESDLDTWRSNFETLFNTTFTNLTQIKTDAEAARDRAETAAETAKDAAEEISESLEQISENESDISDIKTKLNVISENLDASYITQNLNSTSGGVTIESTQDGKIKIYGTAVSVRQIGFLNGQTFTKTSSGAFEKTIDAGYYRIEAEVSGYNDKYTIRGTYTTFADFFVISSSVNPRIDCTLTDDTMIAFTTITDTDYGTSDNPTYLSFKLVRLTAKDTIARNNITTLDGDVNALETKVDNAVLVTEQSFNDTQSKQARKNIDSVGNDTLYKYNAFDAFALGTETAASGTQNGIQYTKNVDGSWTVNGTATALSYRRIINSSTTVPRYIIPGRTYKFRFNGGNVNIQLYIYENESTEYSESYTYNSDFIFTFPVTMTGILLRLMVPNGTTINNETIHYTFIPQPLNIGANKWLESVDIDSADESGKTDVTNIITSMLTDNGYCHLGEGIFYISGIDMPEGSSIVGCGKKTILRLLQSSNSSYCIKITALNTISNLCISGGYNAPSITTQGTRTGVLFSANYDGQEGTTQYESDRCLIDNLWIEKFSDSGIKCHNTSISFRKGIYATNIMISSCWCGLNIDYYSEFNKFTNILTSYCTIGCTNNGGNNVFTSCTFHGSSIAFKIDGTQPNSAHGTLNGCTFCHAGSNSGSAITIDNASRGFVISDCQIWYNSVDITNSAGIVFSGCEFGRGTTGYGATINIDGGNSVMFIGCAFIDDVNYPPDITVTNNTKVKFNSCYGSVSGNEVGLT